MRLLDADMEFPDSDINSLIFKYVNELNILHNKIGMLNQELAKYKNTGSMRVINCDIQF